MPRQAEHSKYRGTKNYNYASSIARILRSRYIALILVHLVVVVQPWKLCASSESTALQAARRVKFEMISCSDVAVAVADIGSSRFRAALHFEVGTVAICRCKASGSRESSDQGEETHVGWRSVERRVFGSCMKSRWGRSGFALACSRARQRCPEAFAALYTYMEIPVQKSGVTTCAET